MARTSYKRDAHTNGILAVLNTALTAARVGDGEAPAGASAPYVVLYSVGQGDNAGPLADDRADVDLLYQVTAVGITRKQAEDWADRARAALLATAPTVADRVLTLLAHQSEPVQRDDSAPGTKLYYAIDTYRWHSVPA